MASQMLSLVCLLFTLMVHNSAGSLRLDVSPTDILPAVTDLLTINCSFSYAELSNISGIITLIVSKTDQDGKFIDLASLNAFTPDDITTLAEVDGEISGHIDPDHESYLSVTLPLPSHNDTGLYSCEMNGVDNHGRPSELFQTSQVTSHEPSRNQLLNKVMQLQHRLQQQSDKSTECQLQLGRQENLAKNQSDEISSCQLQLERQKNFFNTFYVSFYNDRYYIMSNDDWSNATLAAQICHDYGGYLAQITDDSQNEFLKNFVGQYTPYAVLISGSDEGHEGRWTYTGTGTNLVYTAFSGGEPNEGTLANCIAMWEDFRWGWADIECTPNDHAFKVLCELETLFQ